MSRGKIITASVMALGSSLAGQVHADTRVVCGENITRQNIVPCALQANLRLRAAWEAIEVAKSQKQTAKRFLPANPVVSFLAGRREGTGSQANAQATNWYVTLAQELEIANQRGARVDASDARLHSEQLRKTVTARAVAVAAWLAYFDALAADERLALSKKLEQAAQGIAEVALARVKEGLSARVEADLAEASALRVSQTRIEAEQQRAITYAELTVIVGRDPTRETIAVAGTLKELHVSQEPVTGLSDDVIRGRPEVQSFLAESRAQEAEGSVYRRTRIPNPTLLGFIQNDGFNERVFGLGIQLPLPLPDPIGRTYAGEIAAAEARSRQAKIEAEQTLREWRLRLVRARASYASRQAKLALYTPERIARAEQALTAIAEEIRAGRLPLRDALLTQQSLIALLQDYVDVKLAVSIAAVELAYAAGTPLERGVR